MSFRRGQDAKNGTLNRSEAPPQAQAAVETPAAPQAVAPQAVAPVQQQLAVSSVGGKTVEQCSKLLLFDNWL